MEILKKLREKCSYQIENRCTKLFKYAQKTFGFMEFMLQFDCKRHGKQIVDFTPAMGIISGFASGLLKWTPSSRQFLPKTKLAFFGVAYVKSYIFFGLRVSECRNSIIIFAVWSLILIYLIG